MSFEIYPFGVKETAKIEPSVELLGGKGAGLFWMQENGFAVPPGFVIPTTAWSEYASKPSTTMKTIRKMVVPYLKMLEMHFGYMPLLSVRSGARVSCPGMMDTILNVGIDSMTEQVWLEKLGAKCYMNSRHRLITMYGSVVDGLDRKQLEDAGGPLEAEQLYKALTTYPFPDATEQLINSIEAVFKSWNNERAKVYRKLNSIPAEWGTAVTVQAMVFGNFNDASATGVLFTRNPDTGENKVSGEFLINGQGEDVVAGLVTPQSLENMVDWNPAVAAELETAVKKMEKLKKDMQDVEFTVQDGKLYFLQTRNGKRSASAALKIALDLKKEGLVTAEEAIKKVTPKQYDQAQLDVIDPKFKQPAAFTGLSACSGVVSGKPIFDRADAINCKEPFILIAEETTPEDISAMHLAQGVITMTGGYTSHAAVVARGMNRACITGVGVDMTPFKMASVVSMDGATGRIWFEKVPVVSNKNNGLVAEFQKLVSEATGAFPVIYEKPTVYTEMALLEVGALMLDRNEAVDLIVECSKVVGHLYVDFSVKPGSVVESFMTIFDDGSAAKAVVDALAKIGIYGKVTLVGASHPDFPTVGVITNLESLILAPNEIAMTGEALGPAAQKVLNWRKADGLATVSLGIKSKTASKTFLATEVAAWEG